MFASVCPVCKNTFYSGKDCYSGDNAFHNLCVGSREQEKQPVRTSTPVADLENSPISSFSDSVTDFFYQSWKSGLHSSDPVPDQRLPNMYCHQPQGDLMQPVYYNPQVVYVNTVIYQAFAAYPYVPQVGYRPDGTFGVLPPIGGYAGP